MLFEIFYIILKIILIILPLMIFIAYLTYFERRVIGAIQLRKGPNVVGHFGLFQPLADGLKLLTKETVVPTNSNSSISKVKNSRLNTIGLFVIIMFFVFVASSPLTFPNASV